MKITPHSLIGTFALLTALDVEAQTSQDSLAMSDLERQASQEAATIITNDSAAFVLVEALTTRAKGDLDVLLFKQAQESFQFILPGLKNEYSQVLDSMKQSTLNYLSMRGYDDFHIVIADPLLFDVATALDIPKSRAAEMIFMYQTGQDTAPDMTDLVSSISDFEFSPLGKEIKAPPPSILEHEGWPSYLTMIPASQHGLNCRIPGWNRKDVTEYINGHELIHALDFFMQLNQALYQKLPGSQTTAVTEHLYNIEAQVRMTVAYNREALADVAIAGNKVREGRSPEIIDGLIEWRSSDPDDPDHMSVPALKALSRKIKKIGPAEFRALDEEQARNFYLGIIEKHGMNPEIVRKGLRHQEKNLVGKILNYAGALTNTETYRMLELRKLTTSDKFRRPLILTDSQEAQVRENLNKWYGPSELLYDHAIETGGKITPLTLIKAYAKSLDEIYAHFDEDSSAVGYATNVEKVRLLRHALIRNLEDENYLAINAERGINLFKTEACLKEPLEKLLVSRHAPPSGSTLDLTPVFMPQNPK